MHFYYIWLYRNCSNFLPICLFNRLFVVQSVLCTKTICVFQCTDVHMVSDSEGDDFEDAPEFGVDESEIFGMGSSSCRKSPMSKSYCIISSGTGINCGSVFIYSSIFLQCQRTVKMRVMPYCTLLLNFLEGEIPVQNNICNPISLQKTKHFTVVQNEMACVHIFPFSFNV